VGDVLAKHLQRLIPSSLCVFFMYDYATDELVAEHATGEQALLISRARIAVGQGLSGWVAANRRTILNSDPALDFSSTGKVHSLTLRSCLSTPLVSDRRLVGVLSLYSNEATAFSDDHRRIVEILQHQIAYTLCRAADFDTLSRRDPVTGVPHIAQLEHLIDNGSSGATVGGVKYSLLFIDIPNLNQLPGDCELTSDDIVKHTVRRIQLGLRFADILFRHSSNRFVAFLNQTDRDTADLVADRIRDGIRRNPVRLPDGRSVMIHVTVNCGAAHVDGRSLGELQATAQFADLQQPEPSSVH